MADSGQTIVIKRGTEQAYVLAPVPADDLYFTSEMIARIQEIIDGKSIVLDSKQLCFTSHDGGYKAISEFLL